MALITIIDKGVGDKLTSAEINQILDALKDGTKEVNCSGMQVAGVLLSATIAELNCLHSAGVSNAEFAILDGLLVSTTQINILGDDGAKGNALIGRSAGGAIGNIQTIDGNPNITSPLAFLNMPFWVKKEINHDDTSPVTILSIGDGYIVHRAIVKVTEAWDDSSKAFKVGHGSDDDAFITDLGAALATPKYYGFDNTYWGVRLDNSVDKHSKLWIADGAYDLKATFVGTGNGGSQGICDVYILMSKLD